MTGELPKQVEVQVFFDGDCPLCMREIRLLRRMDRGNGRILFTDISEPGFRPSDYTLSMDEFMASIRGRDSSGNWLEGVEVFRRLYAAVGLGPLVALTRLPGVDQGLEAAYRVFARNRLRLTGRSGCSEGSCEAPAR